MNVSEFKSLNIIVEIKCILAITFMHYRYLIVCIIEGLSCGMGKTANASEKKKNVTGSLQSFDL